MLGGAIWCTGQLAVIPIVQTIGIAKGLIIWGSTAMLAGWACGVWGLLGVSSQAEAVHSWALNLSGLALCLASLGFSLLIRPSVGDERPAAKVAPMLEEQLLPAADGAAALPAWLRALDASQRPPRRLRLEHAHRQAAARARRASCWAARGPRLLLGRGGRWDAAG